MVYALRKLRLSTQAYAQYIRRKKNKIRYNSSGENTNDENYDEIKRKENVIVYFISC